MLKVDGKIPGYGDNEDFDGPMKKRGCTDVLCLLIFLAYVIGMVRFRSGFLSLSYGNDEGLVLVLVLLAV